jgi:hypothetical protein
MLTWRIQWQAVEEAAISTGSGEGIESGNECKVFASHNFRRPADRLFLIHRAVVIHEQPVVYYYREREILYTEA